MDATYVQSTFGAGQFSKFSQGNFTNRRYPEAMAVCFNGFPAESENWVRRPGTMQGGTTRGGANGRVIEFDFDQANPYTLEFTAGYLRFWSGTNLVVNSDSQAVLAVSAATPAVVQTAANGWVTGQQFIFENLSVGDPYLLNRQFVGTVVDSTHISLADAVTGASLDGSLLLPFGTGTIARVTELSTPYIGTSWSALRAVQAETQSVLLQTAYAPQVLSAIEPSGAVAAQFAISPAQFVDGPYNDPVGLATLTPASTSGTVGFTITLPDWTAGTYYDEGDLVAYSGVPYQSRVGQNLNNEPDTSPDEWQLFLTSDQLGRQIRLFSEPPTWAAGTTYAAADSVKYNNSYWTSLVGSNTGNAPGADITKWGINAGAATWAWGTISSLTGAVSTIVDPAAGTIIKNASGGWTDNAALAFNTVTTQTWNTTVGDPGITNCGVTGAPTNTYIGKNFGGQTVSYVLIYGPANVGFSNLSQSLTCKLYGSATAPANATDGTLLGSASVSTNLTGSIVQVNSSDTATSFNYLWIQFVFSTNTGAVAIAQIQFFTTGSFSGIGISATLDAKSPELLYTTVFPTWRLGLFTPNTGYPACGTYHEGRLWLSGLVSNRLDASALTDINGDPATSLFYFTPTINDGTVTEACAIDYTLEGPDVNAVFWMQPDQQGIIVGTQAGEWLVQATTLNSPLSPLNMQAHRVTKIGDANIEPRRTDHTNVFVQRSQFKLMEYFADVFSGKFSAPNLAKDASDLAARGIAELAYQKDLVQIIWMRCNDGTFIGATYKRDTLMTSSGPTINGWHAHQLGSSRLVESVCMGASSDGNFDALTMVARDASTGINYVEVVTNLLGEGTTQAEAQYLDASIAVTYTSQVAAGTGFPYGGLQLNGLWPLNGKTVTAWLGGLDCGDYVVSNGTIQVPYGDGVPNGQGSFPSPGTNRFDEGLFTASFVSTGITANGVTMFTGTMPALVGFSFTSQGQLLRPITPVETGSRNGPAFGKLARGHYLMALFEGTAGGAGGVQMGYKFTDLKPALFKGDDDNTNLTVDQQFSGVFRDQFDCDYDFDTQPCWQISRPQICNVQAFGSARETADV